METGGVLRIVLTWNMSTRPRVHPPLVRTKWNTRSGTTSVAAPAFVGLRLWWRTKATTTPYRYANRKRREHGISPSCTSAPWLLAYSLCLALALWKMTNSPCSPISGGPEDIFGTYPPLASGSAQCGGFTRGMRLACLACTGAAHSERSCWPLPPRPTLLSTTKST